MHVSDYLERIGFHREIRHDEATLKSLHRAHTQSIPYENLDVQLGDPVGFDAVAIFDKLVRRRRGGWCYEQNGLMGWALRELGFSVTRMAAAVGRVERGALSDGNHLILRVDLDQSYLCDAGFGEGLIEATALTESAIEQDHFIMGLSQIGGGWWRFQSPGAGAVSSFDFQNQPAIEAQFAAQCDWLQSNPDSPFVQNAVTQIWRTRDGVSEHVCLRGKVLTIKTTADSTDRVLSSAEEYAETLANVFGIVLPEARTLWPKIEARHAALFGWGFTR